MIKCFIRSNLNEKEKEIRCKKRRSLRKYKKNKIVFVGKRNINTSSKLKFLNKNENYHQKNANILLSLLL